MNKVMLCVDSYAAKDSTLIGLQENDLDGIDWLLVVPNGCQAREKLNQVDKVWVVSSDDIEPINLAAALKKDDSDKDIILVSSQESGSFLSRCLSAGIMARNGFSFVKDFENTKQFFAHRESRTSKPGRTSFESNSIVGFEIEEPDILDKEKLIPIREGYAKDNFEKVLVPSRAEQIIQGSFPVVEHDKKAFVFAVVSGNGGVGKSSVSAILGAMLQSLGKKTLLLDADLQFGDLKYLLGLQDEIDITDILANPERVLSLKPSGDMPALIASPKKLEHSEIVINRMSELITYLKGYFDYIVINTGSFWSEQHAQILEEADSVLFLLDQRPSSIRSCSHVLDLCSRCGIATQSFTFLLNHCSRHALFTSLDVSCALQGVPVRELKDGGKEVSDYLGSGALLELLESNNAFCESLRAFLYEQLPDILIDGSGKPASKRLKKWIPLFSRKERAACL